MMEVSRQLGVIQTLLTQEEVQHRQIMMDLQDMLYKLDRATVQVDALHDTVVVNAPVPEVTPTVVDDVTNLAGIVHRRAKIAMAIAAMSGLLIGGATGAEIKNIVQKVTEIFGGT
jgi:hypothetical protein